MRKRLLVLLICIITAPLYSHAQMAAPGHVTTWQTDHPVNSVKLPATPPPNTLLFPAAGIYPRISLRKAVISNNNKPAGETNSGTNSTARINKALACSITLTSGAGTNAQVVCNNTPITNITYSTTDATGATFGGLPTGVTGGWAANVVTISGTPAVIGTFNYTVTLTGGGCESFNAAGTITANPIPDVNQPADQAACTNANTALVNFSGTVPNTVFNWTNNNTTIGLAANGKGDIPSFSTTNATNAPAVATVTVTPTTTGLGSLVTQTFNYTGAVQNFTVPEGVTSMRITAAGAQGGTSTVSSYVGGLGATMSGTFNVIPGSTLQFIVGGKGNNDPYTGGGGGGSGVNNNGTPLIVAGGGAGIDFQEPFYSGIHATTAQEGNPGSGAGGAGGIAGADGGNFIYSGSNISYGGRGWNAGNSGSFGQNGTSPNTSTTNGTWGLGGGGGSVGSGWCNCGGGGGGYSGGGSGNINASGGGGGSFNSGTDRS